MGPTEDVQLDREASLKAEGKRGAGRLLRWAVWSVPPAPLTESPGDRSGFVRAEELVGPACVEGGRASNLTDGHPRLMGLDDSPDPLALGVFGPPCGEAEPGGELLHAQDPLSKLVVGFHPL